MVFPPLYRNSMKTRFTCCATALGLILVVPAACNRETPVRTRDDIAADSALAADLALANRDTLVIDSIGQYRPTGQVVPSDTDLAGSLEGKARPASPPSTPSPILGPPVPARPNPPAIQPAPPTPQPAPARVAPSSGSTKASAPRTGTRRAGSDPCGSPAQADQDACVHSRLAVVDMRLNRIYRALITETRRREGIGPGQKDPQSVERLRASQRAWLVRRDTECRRRGRGKEGALWARPRVQCLGEFATRRANELADVFSRLTAR